MSKTNRMYLVTGAAGFLGSTVCRKLVEKNERVTFSVYNLARNNRFDSSKASKELGYTTRSYRETIRDEIRWLKAVGKIA